MKKTVTNIVEKYFIAIGRIYLTVCLFVIPILLLSDTLDPALAPRFVAWSIALAFLFFNLLFHFRSGKKVFQYSTENYITIAIISYLFLSLFSTIICPIFMQNLFDLLKIVMFVAHVYACSIIFKMDEKAEEFTIKLVCICCLTISLLGLLQYYQMLSFKIPGNIYHLPYSTMANKNLFASLLFLMVPLVFFGLSLKGIWSILHVFTLSIATLNIVLTQTRAVYLAVGICILCLILWYGMYNYFDKLKRFNIPWQYKIGIVIIAFSIAFASLNQSIFHGDASILQTFNTVADFSDQSIHQRLVMWKNSLLMVKDHPLNGVGINNWQIEFPKYGLREMSVPVQQGEVHFQRPHNDFLWVMSETGVLGFFAYIAIFIFSISCCFKIILSSQSQHDHFLVIALICQVIGFSVISFFDFPKERIEHLVYFGFVLSMVNHYSYKYNVMTLKVSRTWVTSVIIALSTGILIAVYIGNSRLKSEIYMRNALNARALENWNGVIDYIDKARTPFFALDLMSTPLSWYSGVAYFSKNEIATAHQNFLEAYRIHPYHLHVLNNLATCEQLSNNPNKALELYLKALQISPSFEPSLRNLSVVYYNKGLYEEAYSTIRQCNQNDTLAMQYSDIIKSKLHIQ